MADIPGGAAPGLGGVTSIATKFSSVAINVLLPVGTFIAGYAARDPAGLEGIIQPYLPKPVAGSTPLLGRVSGLVTGLVYAALFGLIVYMGSSIGGLIGGVVRGAGFFFLGCAVRMVLAGLQGGILAGVLPSNAT